MSAGADPGLRGRRPSSASPRPTLRHRLEAFLFRAIAAGIRGCPERLSAAAGAALGALAREPLGIRRALVDEHLRRAFPGRDGTWRRRVARACYRHLGREAAWILRLADLEPEEVRARTSVEGLETFLEAIDRRRGVVLVTGHLGNWEVGGAALAARGIPLDVVALRQGNPLFHRETLRLRTKMGMRVIERDRTPGAALRALRRGRVVALLGDQNPIAGGIEIPFFGRPAPTPRGPAVLSLRTGSPLFLGVAVRTEGDQGRWVVSLEAVDATRSGSVRREVRRLVGAYTRRLEDAIRETPEQYFWLHRRWKERR